MALFGFGKKKIDKAAWSEAIYGKPLKHPENESEELLSSMTTGLLMQDNRIIMDSIRIVRTTKNADTRKSRMDLCNRHYQKMTKLKPFCNKEQLVIINQVEEALKSIGLQ